MLRLDTRRIRSSDRKAYVSWVGLDRGNPLAASEAPGGIRFSGRKTYFNGSDWVEGIRLLLQRASGGIRFRKRGS